MPQQHQGSLLRAVRQGGTGMKQLMTRKVFIIVILIILVTQKNLCEIRLRTGVAEVAVSMACSALK